MESQRVRGLTKGYLRGWLTFDYKTKYSKLRENLILREIENEEYEELLLTKLQMDSVLVAGASNKTHTMLNGLNKTYRLLLALKLPDLAGKDTIESERALDKNAIADYKKLLENIKSSNK